MSNPLSDSSETNTTASTCPYCGVGCGVLIRTENTGKGPVVVEVKGDPSHPANRGRLCSKGSTLAQTATVEVYRQVRASQPQWRFDRDQPLQDTTWDAALGHLSQRFADLIEKHGPNSVAFYISGQLLTEDYYAFNKLSKGLIGTNNVDTNSRLCMSSAVSGYKRSLGADAPPCSYEDIELANCVVIAGSNMAYAHPVLYRRLEQARANNPNHTLIVIDPRRTETAEMADLHLALQPGTDVMLFNAMLNVQIQSGWIDPRYISQHTQGFEQLAEQVASYTPQLAAQVCGLAEADIVTAARWFAFGQKLDADIDNVNTYKPTLSLYCQGLNQASTGTAKNSSLINLHLATGQIGQVGAGPFSLTGQPNAMGGREVGGLATLLPGHRELNNPQHRAEIAKLWNVKSISEQPGASAVELFERLEQGEIKAVWIACTNPAHSMPNSLLVQKALKKAELVVVQDAYHTTATAQYADVLLPATTWAEKEGTVTNSERRISRVRAALPPWGNSKHDWQIVTEFAKSLETQLHHRGLLQERLPQGQTLFNWSNPEALFEEHKLTTQGRDLDIMGVSYTRLDNEGPMQWPVPSAQSQSTPRLYTQGQFPTPSGCAQFQFHPYQPVAEEADARYPWRLNTGRLRDQWHGASRTGTLPSLFGQAPEPVLGLNPKDLLRLQLQQGNWVRVKSRRGSVIVRVKSDDTLQPMHCQIPMHWGPEWWGGLDSLGGVNALTSPVVDPYSKQPELKHCAVHIEPATMTWECEAALEHPQALALLSSLRFWFTKLDVVTLAPTGRDRPGVLFRAACAHAPSAEVCEALSMALGFEAGQANSLRYNDAKTGASRQIQLLPINGLEHNSTSGQGVRLTAYLLMGQVQSAPWLHGYFESGVDVSAVRLQLLSASHQAPAGASQQGLVICNCLGVRATAIEQRLEALAQADPDATPAACLSQLQTQLACGTQCGSCLPQLRLLIGKHLPKRDSVTV